MCKTGIVLNKTQIEMLKKMSDDNTGGDIELKWVPVEELELLTKT